MTAGFLVRQHWHVKPDTLTAGLAAALRRDGVEIQEGAEVFELVRQGNRLTHVRTAAGDLEADTVVLAAGAWTTRARALDRRLDPDGGGQGLQLLDPPDRHAVARDPAVGRARRLHARTATASASAARWSSAASTTASTGGGSTRS